jgi:hypothetical protein
MPITKEQFFASARTLPYEDVPCPELDGTPTIRVRCLTALEKDKYEVGFWYTPEGSLRPVYDAAGARARLVSLACIHEDGTSFFSDDDVAALRESRGDVVDRLFGVAQRLSGLNATLEEMKIAFRLTRTAK